MCHVRSRLFGQGGAHGCSQATPRRRSLTATLGCFYKKMFAALRGRWTAEKKTQLDAKVRALLLLLCWPNPRVGQHVCRVVDPRTDNILIPDVFPTPLKRSMTRRRRW